MENLLENVKNNYKIRAEFKCSEQIFNFDFSKEIIFKNQVKTKQN